MAITIKKAPQAAPKVKKGKAKAKKEGKRPVGKTSGLGIVATWVKVFEENEKAKKKLTDPQISAHMKKEFPGRTNQTFLFPQRTRNDYNKGRLTGGTVPKVQSFQYDEKGEAKTPRRGRQNGKATKKATGGKGKASPAKTAKTRRTQKAA